MAASQSRGQSRRFLPMTVAGAVVGLLCLAIFVIVRGRDHDTLVLNVGPVNDPNEIRIYVGGAVTEPGLYSLPRGSRVADALAAAGGPAPGADVTGLGMAAILEDADQIIVPSQQAVPTPAAFVAAPPTAPATTATQAATPGPININSATAAELESLPRIGPALAARIVAYRLEHGPFQSVDELEAVSGISQAMVDELRPLITAGP